jgi:hypothetical protein
MFFIIILIILIILIIIWYLIEVRYVQATWAKSDNTDMFFYRLRLVGKFQKVTLNF